MPTNDLTVPQDKQQELAASSSQFASRIKDLQELPLSQVKASMGRELVQIAKRYLDSVHVIFDPPVDAANKLHKSLTQLRGKFLAPGEQADAAGRSAERAWEIERQRRVESARLEQERVNRIKAEQDRAEELAAMKAQEVPAKLIQQRQADPIIIAAPAVNEDRGKVSSTQDKWIGNIKDLNGFVEEVLKRKLVALLLSVEQNELNKFLTRCKGSDTFNGTVEVQYAPVIRSKAV